MKRFFLALLLSAQAALAAGLFDTGTAAGPLLFSPDATQSIGNASSNRPKNLNLTGTLNFGGAGENDGSFTVTAVTSTTFAVTNASGVTNASETGQGVQFGTGYIMAITAASKSGSTVTFTTANTAFENAPLVVGDTVVITGTVQPAIATMGILSTGVFYQEFSTKTTGNTRGSFATDLQRDRSGATMVASGDHSVLVGGQNNTASGSYSMEVGGYANAAGGTQSVVVGGNGNTAGGNNATSVGGVGNYANATGIGAFVGGQNALADRYGMFAFSSGQFSANGDSRWGELSGRAATTDATVTELFLDGAGASARLTVPTGGALTCIVQVIGKQTGTANVFAAHRRVVIVNNGGTVALDGSADTATGWADHNTPAWGGLVISADNTNKSLKLTVQGAAATNIHWTYRVSEVELAY